jgi:hypothetical protein
VGNEQSSSAYLFHLPVFGTIARKKVGNRPGRQGPGRVKRRPKTFPQLQKARYFYHKKEAA